VLQLSPYSADTYAMRDAEADEYAVERVENSASDFTINGKSHLEGLSKINYFNWTLYLFQIFNRVNLCRKSM
jgi:hypothetical protein